MTTRKHIRHKLLFDEGLPRKESFPQLNNLHTVRHINHDLKKSGMKDGDIYLLAQEQKYIVVVFNTKDFRPFVMKYKPSIITLSTSLTNKQIESKICKILRKLKLSESQGHIISITNEGETVKEVNV
jgi:uncharacterized protein DUF5615